ncbi:PH domain-containing protein [Aquipuribacter hungaricus]|uniref:PH domain-containing protein n=1 Tax=Aquipuribacter hungaricus TaxID=545624 RepID=UPI0036212DBB
MTDGPREPVGPGPADGATAAEPAEPLADQAPAADQAAASQAPAPVGAPAAGPPAPDPAALPEPADPDTPPARVPGTPRVPFTRLHPVSPLVRGWAALLFGLALVLDGVVGGPLPGPEIGLVGNLWVQVAVVVGIALVVVLANVLSWRFSRYSVDDTAVYLHSGVLSRTQRQARLDRLQAIDVVQPLIGRLVGLAELRIEVAGGSDSQVRLRYLKEAEAHRLRNALLAAAAGVDYEQGEEAPEAPEREVLQVPPGRLVAGTALTGTVLVLLLGTLVLVTALVVVAFLPGVSARAVLTPLAAIGPGALIAIVLAVAGSFARSFAFRLAESPDGLRVRAGLTETRSATVPPGRVQAVLVSQSWLWRRFDWWHVKVNIAGYAATDGQESSSAVLLPVGTRDDVRALLALVVPGGPGPDGRPGVDDRVLEAGLSGRGPDAGFVTAPRAARWLDPLAWRRTGYAATDRVLLARTGLLDRHLVVVPHERTQSVGLQQGPVQRRLGLVSVRLHSTPGPVDPVVPHLSAAEGARLLREQGARAGAARAASGPERWMRRVAAAPQPEVAPPVLPPGPPA